MGLMLTTDYKGVKVIRKDAVSKAGNPYSRYSLMTSSKNKDGEWVSGFIDVQFKKGLPEVYNKAVIKIKNAFPTVDEYNGNKTIRYIITDFEILEEGEKPVAKSDDGFLDVNDSLGDEMPFN